MWPFSRKKHANIEPTTLLQRVKDLEMVFDHLDDRYKRLDIQFQKLSGRYYRRFGTGDSDPAATPEGPTASAVTKAELRKQLGIVPGRPYHHKG